MTPLFGRTSTDPTKVINNEYQSAIDFGRSKFTGMTEYYYSLDRFHMNGRYSRDLLLEKAHVS